MNPFWSSCLRQLEQELPPQQFNTWIKALRLEDVPKGAIMRDGEPSQALRLVAPNRFVLQWVRERYLRRLEDMAKQFFAGPVSISIDLPDAVEAEHAETAFAPSAQAEKISGAMVLPAVPISAPDAAYDKTRLNQSFTFDTLVTGRANDLARAAAYQVALNPGTSYNPLFIYGGVGLGKTHLIHALGKSSSTHSTPSSRRRSRSSSPAIPTPRTSPAWKTASFHASTGA
jgi:chromosomal replication initiator protein